MNTPNLKKSPKFDHVLLQGLLDETIPQIRSESRQVPRRKERMAPLSSMFRGVQKNGVIMYTTPSGTTKGKLWYQHVLLLDLPSLYKKYKGKRKDSDIVRMAIKGNVEVLCDCDSWVYWGAAYLATQKGYNMGKAENRKPKKFVSIKEHFSVCKHLDNVLQALPFHSTVLVRRLREVGYLN